MMKPLLLVVAAALLLEVIAPDHPLAHGSLVVAVPESDHVVVAADSATTVRMVRGPADACKLAVGKGYAIGITGVTQSGSGELYDVPRALRTIVQIEPTAQQAVSRLLEEQSEMLRLMAVASKRKGDALYRSMLQEAADDGQAAEELQLLVTLLAADMKDNVPRVRTVEAIVGLPRNGILAIERSRLLPRSRECEGGRCGSFLAIGHVSAVMSAFVDAPRVTRLSGGWTLARALLEAQASATPSAVGPPFSAVRIDASGVTWIDRQPPC